MRVAPGILPARPPAEVCVPPDPRSSHRPNCNRRSCGIFNSAGTSKMQNVIVKNPNILGGEPVFRGTRVPFKVLTDYLEGGDTLDQFLEQYPSVSRALAIAAIEEARSSLVSRLG
jgi:uncharacterized protein (DUF433 family)